MENTRDQWNRGYSQQCEGLGDDRQAEQRPERGHNQLPFHGILEPFTTANVSNRWTETQVGNDRKRGRRETDQDNKVKEKE